MLTSGLLSALALFAVQPPAVEPGPAPIATDRPDFTESALVVPRRSVQLEAGFTLDTGEGGYRGTTGPEALFRIGVTERFELRLGLPNYTISRSGGTGIEGFGDTYLGAKWNLGSWGRTEVAVIPAVFIPTGRRGLRGESASPEVKLVAAQGLSGGRALSGMVYVASVEESGRRRTPVQLTLSLGAPVRGPFAMFLEGVADVLDGERTELLLHTGLVLAVGRNAQFDVHVAASLRPETRYGLIAAGYSVRF